MPGKICKVISFAMISVTTHVALAQQLTDQNIFHTLFKNSTLIVQAGAFNASQGNAQDIGINSLIGNQYTVTNSHAANALFGIGYYLNGLDKDRYRLMYGVDAFYFGPTVVRGDVIQEQIFSNLSYRYSLANYPIYAAAKALFKNSEKYNLTFDMGIGPNFIRTSSYRENSLDNGVTIPDDAFSGKTSLALSAMTGVGIQFNNVFGHTPLELGYRFFYLGQGKLNCNNSQYLGTLTTGNNYANALTFSVSF